MKDLVQPAAEPAEKRCDHPVTDFEAVAREIVTQACLGEEQASFESLVEKDIAAALRAAGDAEKEACAKIMDAIADELPWPEAKYAEKRGRACTRPWRCKMSEMSQSECLLLAEIAALKFDLQRYIDRDSEYLSQGDRTETAFAIPADWTPEQASQGDRTTPATTKNAVEPK